LSKANRGVHSVFIGVLFFCLVDSIFVRSRCF